MYSSKASSKHSPKHCVVLDIVGFSASLLGENTPNINRYIQANASCPMEGVFPAVTTTAQSSMLTGLLPSEHGVVGNGWYERDMAEVMFWKQSNSLVQGNKIWHKLKQTLPDFRTSKIFWWYNMYADVEASITPRPHYPADGRKIIDLYSTPPGLHQSIESKIGKFPFFSFWGPKAGLPASRWIADAAMLEYQQNKPNLQLVYLPHLDYCLQKYGPSSPLIGAEVKAIDAVVGELLDFYEQQSATVLLVSEYGIVDVDTPIHINRILREHGYLEVRDSLTWELLDPGASRAFAVSDHQVAHVYLKYECDRAAVKQLLENLPGVDCVLDHEEKKQWGIAHARAGDLVVVSKENAWFTYYYWLDERKAPDFAPTVDIHRKPGYDPAEMFVDQSLRFPMLKVMMRLLQKKLGMRMLMDVISLDASLVKGSHGRPASTIDLGPIFIGPKDMVTGEGMKMTDVAGKIEAFFAD
ncbi:MAG: alkaline phosphatase family protein [Alteromonadaceae bacterium]|nr:MAG: alkaline phosphatase family protein [Alteromonadaceae bacterium]